MAAQKKRTFEQAKQQLDAIVEQLSGGSLALDDMVKLYEEGAALSGYCLELLDAYDARITTLSEGGGETLKSEGTEGGEA
ncbi:MAG: exodeoxyribonuclease VII small subunit [Christensenellaceae bacterium]|jgi:exodeoxyribonuclease VII small subunit|nr:exodeoxyribonuclease VII small subunit [Christensenellaceae bacterium]